MSVRRRTLAGFLGAALATLAVYSASLRGGFVYDDHWAIQRNAALARAPARFFWTNPDTGADPASGLTHDVYRPLTVLSFAVSLRVWGKRLTLWRMENLAWHLLNGILFALLLWRLGFRWGIGLPFAVALFLLHPMQVSSVAWIYQRGTLISAAGCLAALLLAVAPGSFSGLRLCGSLFFLAAALFAKESAVVFPFIFWLVSEKKMSPSSRRLSLGCFVLCVAGFLALRAALLGGWSQIADLPRGWTEKGVLTLIAVPQYAAKFFIPWGLRASYDLPALTSARVLTAMGGMLLLGFCFYRLLRQRSERGPFSARPALSEVRRRRLADGGWMFGLWSILALAPMLPMAPIRAFFAERFFYLASMGVAALLGLWIETQRRLRKPALLWLMLVSIVTYRYAGAWVSDAALWPWTVQREPSNAFAHMCMAETLSNPQAAQAQYFQALVNQPSSEMRLAAWNNLAVLALAQQEPRKALYWTAQVLKQRPDAAQALYNRWRALKALGDSRQAEALRRTLMEDPRIPQRLFR